MCQTIFYQLVHFRESVAGLRTFLLEQTAAGGDRAVLNYVTDLLNKQVGFLLNERYVNIPAQVQYCCHTCRHHYLLQLPSQTVIVGVLYKVGK